MAVEDYWELIALGVDLGFAALFYSLYRGKQTSEAQIKEAKHYVLGEELYRELASKKILPYACVEGTVQPIHKADTLKSRFGEDVGTIRHTLFTEHTSSKNSGGFWVDSKRNIKDYYDKIPFKLQNPKNNKYFLEVEQPMKAYCIEDELKVTYDKYESSYSGAVNRVIDNLLGKVTKGHQEKERMLTVGTSLLAMGKVAAENSGKYMIGPPEDGKTYFITGMSKGELLDSVRSGSTVLKVLSWICGGIAVGLTVQYLYKKIKRIIALRREEEVYNEIRARNRERRQAAGDATRAAAADDATTEEELERKCVICLDEERSVVLLNCGHICVCVDCAEVLPRPKKCPVCRRVVDRMLPTYRP